MKILDGIRATGSQEFSTSDENGKPIQMKLRYQSSTQNWMIDISYENFTLNGQRVYNSPNILCQYSNIIPFGMGILIPSGGEPFLINDFSSGRVQLAILTAAEVQQIEDFFMEQNG